VCAAYLKFLPSLEPLHHKAKQSDISSSWLVHGASTTLFLDAHTQQKCALNPSCNNQARPCTSHVFSTGSNKGTTAMQKPGNNAKAFGSSSQVVHKNTVES
jgi:hypothetical protein